MDVSKIISISRKQTTTSIWQVSDTDYLDYLNIIYQEMFSRLTMSNKKYARQTYLTNLVANQQEYTIPKRDTLVWLKTVLDCYVNYWDWEKKCKIYNSVTWKEIDYEDYENPFVINRDWSLFLYPVSTTTQTNWFRLEWKYIPLDLETTTVESEIKIWSEYHDTMIVWLNWYIFAEKQQFDKQSLMKAWFEEWMQRMLQEWAMDIESWYIEEQPDLSIYE